MKFREYLLEIATLTQTLQELTKALKKKSERDIDRLSSVALAYGMNPNDLEKFIAHRGGRPKHLKGQPRQGA